MRAEAHDRRAVALRVLAAVIASMALLVIVVLPTACDAEQSVLLLADAPPSAHAVAGTGTASGPTTEAGDRTGTEVARADASTSPDRAPDVARIPSAGASSRLRPLVRMAPSLLIALTLAIAVCLGCLARTDGGGVGRRRRHQRRRAWYEAVGPDPSRAPPTPSSVPCAPPPGAAPLACRARRGDRSKESHDHLPATGHRPCRRRPPAHHPTGRRGGALAGLRPAA